MPGFAIAGSRLQGHPWPWAAASLKSNSPCDCHLCVTCHSVSGPLPLAARKPKAKWCLAVGPVFFQFLAASAMEDLSCSSLCRCFPRSSRIYEPALQDMSFHRRSTLSSRTVPKYQDGLEWTCSQRHHERSSLLVGGWTTTNININIYICISTYTAMHMQLQTFHYGVLDCSFQVAQPKGHGTYPGGQTGQDPAGTPDAVSDPVP